MTEAEKLAAEAAKHAPVPFPAGSFDIEELQKATDKAADAKDRDAAMSKAIADVQVDPPKRDASGTVTGLTPVKAPHPEIEGLVETTQVRDPKGIDYDEIKPGHEPKAKAASGDATTGEGDAAAKPAAKQ